jgi:collagenase-like PrtC family protease
MKFAVGYQMSEQGEEPFSTIVRDYLEHIAEIYFPWGDMPSGRASIAGRRGYTDWTWQERLESDLLEIKGMGIKLDLLFNANCYGGGAVSLRLENQVISLLEHLEDAVGGVDTVTTTSLAVARTVKKHFPQIEVRASVNMRLGEERAMELVSGLFDGYYVQREYNRNIKHIKELKEWADDRGKKLYMLANSGCMACCPGQTFHDNMVAHESEIDETANIPGWTPHVCWNQLRESENWHLLLENSWIRPEDLSRYDNLFPIVKLATRMHAHPRMVLQAYTSRKYRGNLLDLFEPGFSPSLAPYIIDNQRFPQAWFQMTSTCSRKCRTCGYCRELLQSLLVCMEPEVLDSSLSR